MKLYNFHMYFLKRTAQPGTSITNSAGKIKSLESRISLFSENILFMYDVNVYAPVLYLQLNKAGFNMTLDMGKVDKGCDGYSILSTCFRHH